MAAHEQTPASTAPDGEASPTGFKAKLPMLAMVAVGLAIGGGTGAAFIGPVVAKKMGKTAPAHSDSASASSEGGAAEGERAGDGEAAKEGSAATVHLLENLVLNPAGSGGARFLLFTVAIEAGSATVAAEMTTRDAELRDIILTAVGKKSIDELTDIANREVIKGEVQTAISARFGKSSVKRMYFPQFVVQ